MSAIRPRLRFVELDYLLITNSELALGLLIRIGESLEFLDGLRLQNLDAELDIALGVLVARLVKM